MLLTLICLALLMAGGCRAATIPASSTQLEDSTNETLQLSMRSSRINYPYFAISKDDTFFDTKVIPEDHQVNAFLYMGETKLFFFLNDRDSSALIISLTPCTSSIEWSIRFRPQNLTGPVNDPTGEEELGIFRGNTQKTFRSTVARRGLYIVRVRTLERESYVHFYASRSEPLHERAPHLKEAKLRVSARQKRRRLVMRWEPSSVDPHLMHYCVVVNTRGDYKTLCGAKGDRYGVTPPDYPSRGGFDFPQDRQESQKTELASKAARRQAHQSQFDDIVVGCVGAKTHFSLAGLQDGKLYYINLFATNKKSNLSFPYASTTIKYDRRLPKPTGLKDGKVQTVNLRQLDGIASFKFKVAQGTTETQFVVVPCGGGVFTEVTLGRDTVLPSTRVDSFGRLRIKNPSPGRYVLRVTATNAEELRRIDELQVMATSRDAGTWPELPTPNVVHEYRSLRSCDSLVVGWLPAPDSQASRYCLVVRENGGRNKADLTKTFYKKPNQCQLTEATASGRNKQLGNLVSSHCFDMPYNGTSKVMTQHIKNLRPGRSYVVQLIVRRPKGRPLAYDMLQAVTKTACVTG